MVVERRIFVFASLLVVFFVSLQSPDEPARHGLPPEQTHPA